MFRMTGKVACPECHLRVTDVLKGETEPCHAAIAASVAIKCTRIIDHWPHAEYKTQCLFDRARSNGCWN